MRVRAYEKRNSGNQPLAAQMRMRYQAIDNDSVTMLERSDSVVFKSINISDVNIK